MIDTLRLILFLECNMRCSYCCNEQEQFNSQFIKKKLSDIEWNIYKNVCVSGGEPFLKKELLFTILFTIPTDKNIFIYTNGLRINNDDIDKLTDIPNLRCVNVGVHTLNQLKSVNPNLEKLLPVRFMAQDINVDKLLTLFPDRLTRANVKGWKLNQCNMPNEEWVLLDN